MNRIDAIRLAHQRYLDRNDDEAIARTAASEKVHTLAEVKLDTSPIRDEVESLADWSSMGC